MIVKKVLIPTTQSACNQCCYNYTDDCESRYKDCRILKPGISYYFKYRLPAYFKPIDSVPKDSTHFIGLTANGNIIQNIHYACDFSGEVQSPFEGFFDSKHREISVELIGWKIPKPKVTR